VYPVLIYNVCIFLEMFHLTSLFIYFAIPTLGICVFRQRVLLKELQMFCKLFSVRVRRLWIWHIPIIGVISIIVKTPSEYQPKLFI